MYSSLDLWTLNPNTIVILLQTQMIWYDKQYKNPPKTKRTNKQLPFYNLEEMWLQP